MPTGWRFAGRVPLAHPSVADVMNRVRQPFNVNASRFAAATRRAMTWSSSPASYAENLNGLRQIEEGGFELGLEWIPSYGNFITLRVARRTRFFRRLLKRGVIVRPVVVIPVAETCASRWHAAGERAPARRARRQSEGIFLREIAVIGGG